MIAEAFAIRNKLLSGSDDSIEAMRDASDDETVKGNDMHIIGLAELDAGWA
jgi:hypothetical protein